MTAAIARKMAVLHGGVTEGGVDYPIEWVKLAKYVEITGDSADSVHARRKAGKWLDGDECKIVDGNLWINLPAVERWVEAWGQSKQIATAPAKGARRS